jgi:hypothetical protein
VFLEYVRKSLGLVCLPIVPDDCGQSLEFCGAVLPLFAMRKRGWALGWGLVVGA